MRCSSEKAKIWDTHMLTGIFEIKWFLANFQPTTSQHLLQDFLFLKLTNQITTAKMRTVIHEQDEICWFSSPNHGCLRSYFSHLISTMKQLIITIIISIFSNMTSILYKLIPYLITDRGKLHQSIEQIVVQTFFVGKEMFPIFSFEGILVIAIYCA